MEANMTSNYNVVCQAKNITCGVNGEYVDSGPQDLCQDPLLVGPFSGASYGMMPAEGSPAIDAGDDALCPAVDIRGRARPADGDGDGNAICDMETCERQESVAWVYLPLTVKSN